MRPERAKDNSESTIAITQLRMPKRARNALLRAGIRTLEDAIEWTDRDLLSLPHFGHASVVSLRAHIGSKAEEGSPSAALSQHGTSRQGKPHVST